MSTSKSLVLAFIWILLLSFIFILFVYILGVLKKAKTVSSINYDDLDSGTYYCAVNCTNSPDNTSYVWVIVLKSSGVDADATQIAWNINNIWVRRKSGTWGSWLKYNAVADFYKNYATLELLAKASGAMYTQGNMGSGADFNTYTNSGYVLVYTYAITGGLVNSPNDISYGFLEIKRIDADGTRIYQSYYKWGASAPYAYRVKENGSWGNWKYPQN